MTLGNTPRSVGGDKRQSRVQRVMDASHAGPVCGIWDHETRPPWWQDSSPSFGSLAALSPLDTPCPPLAESGGGTASGVMSPWRPRALAVGQLVGASAHGWWSLPAPARPPRVHRQQRGPAFLAGVLGEGLEIAGAMQAFPPSPPDKNSLVSCAPSPPASVTAESWLQLLFLLPGPIPRRSQGAWAWGLSEQMPLPNPPGRAEAQPLRDARDAAGSSGSR